MRYSETENTADWFADRQDVIGNAGFTMRRDGAYHRRFVDFTFEGLSSPRWLENPKIQQGRGETYDS